MNICTIFPNTFHVVYLNSFLQRKKLRFKDLVSSGEFEKPNENVRLKSFNGTKNL